MESASRRPCENTVMEDGANPWYEVILIEGRNAADRECFQSVGFLVEKISACNWGPLGFGCGAREISAADGAGSGRN